MIIGTAGHIDHGKTTLIKALTGVDCDRLKEEKARGITLDLGYAYAAMPDAKAADQVLGFIDVPGHEKLVHNMLAGATGIDFALLVIAADDGPMPQTREHLEIIQLLGIRHAAVALSKIDRVSSERRQTAEAETAVLLAGTPFAEAPVFPVSAVDGAGVAALRQHLDKCAAAQETCRSGGAFRLAVDRSFTLDGIGTVVTGSAFSGSIRSGEQLILTPPGKTVRVRSLRVQDRPADYGAAGQRIALALSGIEKTEIARGMWLVAPQLHLPQGRFAVRLSVLPSQPPLRHWTPIHCHLGAIDRAGRVALLDADEIAPGQNALGEIILDREIGVIAGDRLILRDAAARYTLAGGTVLDIFPPTRKKRSPERLALLKALSAEDSGVPLALAAAQQAGGVDLARFALNRNLAAESVNALCAALEIKRVAGFGFAPARWEQLNERLLGALRDEHARNPDMPGVERDRLRRLTLPTLARPAFDQLIGELLDHQALAQTGAWLHLPEHRVQLAPADRDLWLSFKPLLDATPFNPPRVRDVARSTGIGEERIRLVMKRVARVGELYPVAHDHYFSADAVDALRQRIATLCQRDGMARAASLRDEIGGGRKVAIFILEFFDRIGYTRRVRDSHVLRQPLSCLD